MTYSRAPQEITGPRRNKQTDRVLVLYAGPRVIGLHVAATIVNGKLLIETAHSVANLVLQEMGEGGGLQLIYSKGGGTTR